jgi:hypothetical protein
MSPLNLCWCDKTLLPAKLPQCLLSQFATSCNIPWGLHWDCRDKVSCLSPFTRVPSPGPTREGTTRCQCTAYSGMGIILLASQSKGLRHTWPREMQETVRDGNTTHQSGMNPGLISDQSQEAEGEIDHRLETTRYHSNHGETVPLRFSEWDGSTGLWECVKVLSWDAASCKASEEYWSLGPWPTHKVYFPAEKPLVYSVMPIS